MKMMAPMEVGLTVKDLPMMLDFYCTACADIQICRTCNSGCLYCGFPRHLELSRRCGVSSA